MTLSQEVIGSLARNRMGMFRLFVPDRIIQVQLIIQGIQKHELS